jgi:hypothetical protein
MCTVTVVLSYEHTITLGRRLFMCSCDAVCLSVSDKVKSFTSWARKSWSPSLAVRVAQCELLRYLLFRICMFSYVHEWHNVHRCDVSSLPLALLRIVTSRGLWCAGHVQRFGNRQLIGKEMGGWKLWGSKLDGTNSGSCPMASLSITVIGYPTPILRPSQLTALQTQKWAETPVTAGAFIKWQWIVQYGYVCNTLSCMTISCRLGRVTLWLASQQLLWMFIRQYIF